MACSAAGATMTSGDFVRHFLPWMLLVAGCSPAFAAQLASQVPVSTLKLLAQSDAPQRTPDPGGQDTLLPAGEAFKMSVLVVDAKTLAFDFVPASGDYYLYRDKFAFRVQEPAEVRVTSIELPSGEIKDDPFFGKTESFHSKVRAIVRLQRTGVAPIVLYVAYQGCNERIGVCYPPIEKRLRLELPPPRSP
jgi:thiol:disulfide interchange protein DsbD